MMKMIETLPIVSPKELTQQWAELAHDEQSPDYYELTEYGELVLSPRPESNHQILSSEIAFQMRNQLSGKAVEVTHPTVWLLQGQPSSSSADQPPPPQFANLSSREREVSQLASQGLKNSQIAQKLFIGPHTVNQHFKNIYKN